MNKKISMLILFVSIFCNMQSSTVTEFFKQLNTFFSDSYQKLESIFIVSPQPQQEMVTHELWKKRANNENVPDKVKEYINSINSARANNEKIPVKNNNIRLMTYNVHYWHGPGKSWSDPDNQKNIFSVIETLNPDILILQEVKIKGNSFTKSSEEKTLKKLGFHYFAACNTFPPEKDWFGIIIASKIKPNDIKRKYFDEQERPEEEKRCFLQMELTIFNEPVIVYGSHLEVGFLDKKGIQPKSEDIRLAQLQQILKSAEYEQKQKNIKNVIIAADFNAVRKKDYDYNINEKNAWDLLQAENKRIFGFFPTPTKTLDELEKNNFKDSFAYLKSQGPKFTTWTGTVIDFIMLSPNWNLPLAGSYVYYDAASDHLPIIIDIKKP